MTAEQPDEGQTVLIFADYNGLTAMDVAFYNGRNPDGSHWWTLANVEIAQRCIIAWAVLEEPDFDDRL